MEDGGWRMEDGGWGTLIGRFESAEAEFQLGAASIGSDENAFREFAVRQHLVVDRLLAVGVQPHSREILQSQVPVVIDVGALQPGGQVGRLTGEIREQIE